jgi:hypothetical protein
MLGLEAYVDKRLFEEQEIVGSNPSLATRCSSTG